MTLDPQIGPILEAMAGRAASEPITPEQMRLGMELTATPRSDDGLTGVEDLAIAGVACRCYRPAVEVAPAVIAYFHGGGFVVGSINTHDAFCARLAATAGMTVVSVEYRLAPEHRFPAGLDDCYAVTRALVEEGNAVAVCGDSAGGNLAAAVALLARDAGVAIIHQALIYPVVDPEGEGYASRTENGTGYLLTTEMMHWFHAHYLRTDADKADWRVAPLRADLAGVAPALVVTAQYDPLRDEGEQYGNKLAEAGVPVVVHRYDGMIHGFGIMPVTQADDLLDELATAIRDAARTAPAPG